METPPPKKNETVIPKRSEESQTSICKKLKLSSLHGLYIYFAIYAISFYEYECLVYDVLICVFVCGCLFRFLICESFETLGRKKLNHTKHSYQKWHRQIGNKTTVN